MGDSWERRPISRLPGFNYVGPDEPAFVVTYDAGNDALVVQAPPGTTFDDLVSVTFTGSDGSGEVELLDISVDGDSITIQPASTIFGGPNTITQLDFIGNDPALIGIWTGSIAIPTTPVPSNITSVVSGQPSALSIYGSGFDDAVSVRLISSASSYDETFAIGSPSAPNWMDFQIDILDDGIAGLVIDRIETYGPGSVLMDEWTGSVLVLDPIDFPLITGVYSPAVNTVTFVGERFTTASAGAVEAVVLRLASSALDCFDGGFVRARLDDDGFNDFTIVEVTDTKITLSNPKFTTCDPDDSSPHFTVVGAALDAPNYGSPPGDGYYFLEPWGEPFSTVIDGTSPPPP